MDTTIHAVSGDRVSTLHREKTRAGVDVVFHTAVPFGEVGA